MNSSNGHHKWTYDDFVGRINKLEARMLLLESASIDMELTLLKSHRALCDMHDALNEALTQPPRKFTPQQQAVWDAANKESKK
jgi:hypothetical protein